MTVTTTWNLVGLDISGTPVANLSGVAVTAHWEVLATDDQHPGIQGRTYGSVSLGAPDPASFTPQASLTKAEAIGWVKTALGADVQRFEAQAQAALTRAITPPVTNFMPAS